MTGQERLAIKPAVVNLSQISIAYWLVSWLGVTTAYALSTAQGFVPLCVPFVTGCVSVSAVGRHGLGFIAFKATILPAAALGVLYWTFAVRWIGNASLRQRGIDTTIVVAGVVGSVALALYTIFLGLEGETYRLMRHYGVVAYFASTYLAQVLLTQRLRTGEFSSRIVKLKTTLCYAMLAAGTVLGAFTYIVTDKDAWQNATEWLLTSALAFYPFLTWLLWREWRSGPHP